MESHRRMMTKEQFSDLSYLLGGTPGSATHEALRLVFLEGYTQQAAADQAGISQQAVGNKVDRARELIQRSQSLYGITIPARADRGTRRGESKRP